MDSLYYKISYNIFSNIYFSYYNYLQVKTFPKKISIIPYLVFRGRARGQLGQLPSWPTKMLQINSKLTIIAPLPN